MRIDDRLRRLEAASASRRRSPEDRALQHQRLSAEIRFLSQAFTEDERFIPAEALRQMPRLKRRGWSLRFDADPAKLVDLITLENGPRHGVTTWHTLNAQQENSHPHR